jgi:GT2 family glycosyltransferase
MSIETRVGVTSMERALMTEVQADEQIAVVILTCGRVHLLRQCVENVLSKASDATREIIIWSNGATDDTNDYLRSLDDPRVHVVLHPENIGQSAYYEAFAMTTAPFMLELDDDVIEAPEDWDLTLLRAFRRLPDVGFLAASLVDNPHDLTARAMYDQYEYTESVEDGVRLLLGPTGGYCAITSRELHDRVGGFPRRRNQVFFLEDAAYIERIEREGYRAAILADLEVLHAGGPYYSKAPKEKVKFWKSYDKRVARKRAVKRMLLSVPGVPSLNTRYGWFKPPEEA